MAVFDLLLELCRESERNFTKLQNLLLQHHSSGKEGSTHDLKA